MIDRYDFYGEGVEPRRFVSTIGDYVLYADHEAALRAVCDALEWYVIRYSHQSKYSKTALDGQVNAIEALRIARGE